jgi:hypothetical protein
MAQPLPFWSQIIPGTALVGLDAAMAGVFSLEGFSSTTNLVGPRREW